MAASRRGLERRADGLLLLAFFVLSFFCFCPALTGEFVSDDLNAIVANEYVTTGRSFAEIFGNYSWWGSARADAPGYRPLTTWTFALNHDLAGASTHSWHTVNIFLHALVTWAVYRLASELGARRWSAAAAATLFCVSTIHAEAVAWVVGRAELLAALAYCAGATAVLRFRRSGLTYHLVTAALLVMLGTFAKENGATLLALPVLTALLLQGSRVEKRRDAMSFAALGAGLLAYVAVRATAGGQALGPVVGDSLDNPLASLDVGTRILGALSVFGRYMSLTVWPRSLSIDYGFDALGIGEGFLADRYSLVGVLTVVGGVASVYRLGRTTAVALLLAATSYSLVSNTYLLIGTIMAERLFYLPTVGLALAVFPALEGAKQYRNRKVIFGGLALVCAAYALATFQRSQDWRSDVALFESATKAQPRSARAHMELAGAYGRAGKFAAAEAEFAIATGILPEYAAAWYNLGNLRARLGRLENAAGAYRKAVEHAPGLVQAWHNLALVEQMRGRHDAVVQAFTEAARHAPMDLQIQLSLADALLAAGSPAEAVPVYSRVIDNAGTDGAAARLNRGVALERSRGCEAALSDYVAALDFPSTRALALRNARACLMALGRSDEAGALEAEAAKREIAKPSAGR